MPNDYLSLSGILKSTTLPTDVQLGGVLTPALSSTFIKAIRDNSSFLKKITWDFTNKLTKKRSTPDAIEGVLVRHVAGEAADENQYAKLGVVGAELNMVNTIELNAKIAQETLDDNKDNPMFEKEQSDSFSMTFSNDILYLGMVGIADNTDKTAPFNELAKGWLTIASESTATIKATYPLGIVDEGEKVATALKVVYDNIDPDVKDNATIILSNQDYYSYVYYIQALHQNTALLKDGELLMFLGVPLEPLKRMPIGTYLATDLRNIILGAVKKVARRRWYNDEESALKYKFGINLDYEFDIHKYVTIVTEALA